MKVKELQAILATMDPDTDLRLYCGGEAFYEDHPLDGVEYHEDDGFICFNLTNEGKYGIASEVDLEELENDIDGLDGNFLAIDYAERKKLMLNIEKALAYNDTYNRIYYRTVQEVIEDKYPEIFKEEK